MILVFFFNLYFGTISASILTPTKSESYQVDQPSPRDDNDGNPGYRGPYDADDGNLEERKRRVVEEEVDRALGRRSRNKENRWQ